MPLDGFTEKHEPEDWDMGLGKVIGYRAWTFRRHGKSCALTRKANPIAINPHYTMGEYSSYALLKQLGYDYTPSTGCYCSYGLYGKWGQKWHSTVTKAQCARDDSAWPNYRMMLTPRLASMINCERVLDNPDACGCGIWAYWQLPTDSDFNMDRDYSTVYWPVAGRVEGSERVVIGEKGFRCEKATLTHLFVVHDTPKDVTDELEKTFSIPVLVADPHRPFTNPVHDLIKRNTEPDPMYGPKWRVNDPSWRKAVRAITGF
jgi:hypothetical protein